jgi:hypothetical protein
MDPRLAAIAILILLYLIHGGLIVRATLEGKKTGRQMIAGLVFIVIVGAALYMASTADPRPITQTQPAPIVDIQPTVDAFFMQRDGHTGNEVISGYSIGGGLATPEGSTGNHSPGNSGRENRQP